MENNNFIYEFKEPAAQEMNYDYQEPEEDTVDQNIDTTLKLQNTHSENPQNILNFEYQYSDVEKMGGGNAD